MIAEQINEELIEEIRQAIEANIPLRKKLPDGGRLHIDRQLPFICVYRRSAQGEQATATERLLLGSSSYLLANGNPEQSQNVNTVLQVILESLGKYFDQLCVLELWASPQEELDSLQPGFAILAPTQHTPTRFLEELGNALLHIRVDNLNANVGVTYQQEIAPPEFKPLMTADELDSLNCILLGLAVKPIYRDPNTGELLPFHLDELHNGLNRALKRGFFPLFTTTPMSAPFTFMNWAAEP